MTTKNPTIRAYDANDKATLLHLLELNTPKYFAPSEKEDLEHYLDLAIGDEKFSSLRVCSAYDFFEHQMLSSPKKYAELVREGESHAAAGTRLQLAALKDKVYISDIETAIMLDRMKDELLNNIQFPALGLFSGTEEL